MKVGIVLVCSCMLVFAAFVGALAPVAQAQVPEAPRAAASPAQAQPKVQSLGNERYRIGLVEIDKAQGVMRVPGRVLRVESPLEFLVVTTGGFKSYESLLEVGATAYEFNLGCILIGLDSEKSKPSRFHFDPEPVSGSPVGVFVEWEADGKTRRVDAAELLVAKDVKLTNASWIYTGSIFTPDGEYMAHLDGTLVGFVHDPASVIEHRTGFLDNYGEISVDPALMPAVDTRITLVLESKQKAASATPATDDENTPAGQ